MQHPCKLYREGHEPETFAAVAFLADRIHTLRAGRTIITRGVTLDTEGFSGAGVIIAYADPPDVLGYAVIGAPEYEAERQDMMLHGALVRLVPGAEQRWAS